MATGYENETGVEGAEAVTASEAVTVAEAQGTNAPPVVNGTLSFSTDEDTAFVISEAELLANISDPDGDALTIVSISALGGSLYDNGDGTWTFTPAADYTGTGQIIYEVFDGTNTIQTYASVTVDPVNDAPVVGVPAPDGDRPVNTTTDDHQDSPSLATLADGGWIAVWTSNRQDGSSLGVYGQRFDADGVAVGPEFQVNTNTVNSQREPQVSALEDGGFVVTWRSTGDGSSDGIFSQRYDAAGNAAGGETQVNSFTAGAQTSGSVAGLAGGGHVIAWVSAGQDGAGNGVYAQAFDAAGVATGAEFAVTTQTAGDQDEPQVAALSGGGYVVAWTSDGQDGSGNGVYGQRFGADGSRQGAEFQVNSFAAGAQEEPAIAALEDGGFIVAWRSYNQDGSAYGVYAQRFDANGTAVGAEVQVNSAYYNNQLEPAVTGLEGGGYVITWQSQFQDGSGRGVYGQVFDASGNAIGSEFRVTAETAGDQQKASVTALAGGGFVVGWASRDQDGDGNGVFQRVFNADGTVRGRAAVFYEDGPAVAIAPELQIGDIDSATLVGAKVTITDFVPGEDVLSFAAQAGIAGSFDAQTGILTLTGEASVGDYQAALRSVTYANTGAAPSEGANGLSRSIAFTVDDGGATDNISNTATVTVSIVADVNDAPVVSGDVTLATAEDTALVITQAELLALASDPEGDALTVQNLTAATGTLTNNGDGTWTFNPPAGFDGNIALTYDISDGELVTQAAANVEVEAANEAPILELITDVQVNTFTTGEQGKPSIGTLSDGGYVITWHSRDQDGENLGVYGQRFDANGMVVGGEFQVNSYTPSAQFYPSVTGIEGGGFVVTWSSQYQDGSDWGVYGQRFDANGTAVGPEFQVNTYTSSNQIFPSVAGIEGGGFVVAWESLFQDGSGIGIFGQRYDASGVAVGSEFQVNTFTSSAQEGASVTGLAGGGFVVTWQSNVGQDGSRLGIFGQRYDASGVAVAPEFLVNTYTSDTQRDASVTGLADGGFVVTWSSFLQDGSSYGIYGQRYDASGVAVGFEFRVNTYTSSSQQLASVTGLEGGEFVVTWVSGGQDGDGGGVYGQRYNADGTVAGSEFQVNSYAEGFQGVSSVTGLPDGGFVVTWESDSQDGSGYGIFQKVYNADGTERISPTYVEGSEAVAFAGELTISDVDSAMLVGATVAITDYVAGEDELSFTDQTGISGSYDAATGVLTLSGEASVADYEAALRSVGYRNTSDDPQAGTRSIGIQVDDGGSANSASNVVTAQVNVIAVNDAPVVAGDVALSTEEDTALIVSEAELLALASDPEGDALTVENLTAASGTLTNNGDGTWTFVPPAGFDGTIALSYDVSDGHLTTQATAKVEVEAANEAPVLSLPTPVGGDRQVNTFTTGAQRHPSVTTLADSSYVIVWSNEISASLSYEIHGQRYSASGEAIGDEFIVGEYSWFFSRAPSVTELQDGGFIVTWASNGRDGSSQGVFGQRFSVSGEANGSSFSISTNALSADGLVYSATLSDARVVVSWTSSSENISDSEVYFRMLDASGSPKDLETRINTYTDSGQARPSLTALDGGGFVAVWYSLDQDGSGYGVYGQLFDSDGAAIGPEFQVNSYTENGQSDPSVTALADGGFIVTWQSYGQDGSEYGVFGQRYDSIGSRIGGEFQISTYTSSWQIHPDIVGLSGGGFVAAWASLNQDGSTYGVFSQRFDVSGLPLGDEYQVNSESNDYQSRPSIEAFKDGGYVISWESRDQDGSSYGIFQKIFNADGTERVGPSYVEGSEAVAFTGELTISDVDSATLVGATVGIDDFVAGEDELTFTDQAGITGSYDAATGVLTLTGEASVADYQAALRSVGYRNTSEDPTGTGRDISITVDDGTGSTSVSNTVTAHVNVIAVPDGQQAFGAQTARAESEDLDVFHFSPDAGHQVVEAFAAGSGEENSADGIFDAIEVQKGSSEFSFADILDHAEQAGDDVVITLDEDTSLTLKDVDLAALTADDFRFLA